MTREEMVKVSNRIVEIIGERPVVKRLGMATPEEMNRKRQWDNAHDALMKLVKEYGPEVITGEKLIFCGNSRIEGFTPKGKRVEWYRNHGYTRRSLYCGRLEIDGKVIFTSGTAARCFEYIHTH